MTSPTKAAEAQQTLNIQQVKLVDGKELGLVNINGRDYWVPVVRVADLSLDGSTLTMLVSELGKGINDWMDFDTDCTYTITFKYMTRIDFDALGESDGF